jgi:two-component system, cell cycle response regulator DivK
MEKQQLVLLVDDEEDNRIVYTAILEHYGYAVLQAVNGQDGVQQAEDHRPDLIVMDLSMPVMDGWEATRRIRASAEILDTPVVLLTAHDIPEPKWRSAGFSAYLKKPCPPARIITEIRVLLPPPHVDP